MPKRTSQRVFEPATNFGETIMIADPDAVGTMLGL